MWLFIYFFVFNVCIEDMESKELNLNKESVAGVGNSKGGGDGFIDRSKVRILLCDNDANSSEEVLLLLLKCSYQGKSDFVLDFC